MITKKKKFKLKKADLILLLFALPAALHILVFHYLPMGGLVLAFKNYRVDKGIFGSDWYGFKNFEFFFTSQDAWMVLRNTIVLNVAAIVLGKFVAITIAILLNEVTKRWKVKTYQTILFLPYFLSWVIVSYMVFAFLSPTYGILNQWILGAGGEKIDWYRAKEYWPAILILLGIWKGMGYNSVIYFSAIMGLDKEYYEAARIDGASRFQMATKLTVPLIMPAILLTTILDMGGILTSDFGLFYIVPKQSAYLYDVTTVLDVYIYRALAVTGNTGISAATGLFKSVVGMIMILVTNAIVNKINKDSAIF